MKRLVLLLAMLLSICLVFAQQTYHQKANYDLASRFSPKKLEKMIFSTAVDPHWTKSGNKFWYMYETTAGKKWVVVDPVKMTKTAMFDNDKLAANLTRIVKDPFDGKHLSIENLKFVRDDNWIRFEVKSSLEVEKKDSTKKANTAKEKKVFYFEYHISADSLVELKDHKKPVAKPSWANASPDQKWVVYAKNFNLYRMDTANMRKAALNDQDSTIVEEQLTMDGIQYYGFGEGFGESNVEQLANAKKRKSSSVLWSPNSQHFVVMRTDSRKVKDLWVLNSIAEPRPTLETYKYHMPGEKEAPMREMHLFAVAEKKMQRIGVELFKDQEVAAWPADMEKKMRDEEHRPIKWLGDDNRFYLAGQAETLRRLMFVHSISLLEK